MADASVAVMECDACTGVWLGIETFERMVERAAKQAMESESARGRPPTAGPDGREAPQRWQYRPCPVCEKLMQRRHYGRQSGVIVDICRDHGFWFDADELPRILTWVRQGGLETAARLRAEREKAAQLAPKPPRVEPEVRERGSFERPLDEPWQILFEVVGRFFDR